MNFAMWVLLLRWLFTLFESAFISQTVAGKDEEIIWSMQYTVYWNVRACSLIEGRRCFGVTCSLIHQGS